jgi:hypothetical protein
VAGLFRVAGTGRLPTGETITWSIADGRRGRRWRELLSRRGRVIRSLLLEIAPDGGIGRLEVATAAGLLTVHPSTDLTTLHGNVVASDGVRHLTLAWSEAHLLVVDRSPMVAAAILGRSAGTMPPGGRARFDGVRVGTDLRPAPVTVLVSRIGPSTWDTAIDPTDAGLVEQIALDRRGLPILLDPAEWPLEA